MAGKIKDWQKKLRSNAKLIERGLLELMKEYEQEFLDLNREQMMHGEDSEGNSLGVYASEAYSIMKEAYNPLGVVDLRLTGSFHALMYLDTSKFPVLVWSDDEKTDDLINKYGKVFGLNKENQNIDRTPGFKKAAIEYLQKMLQL